MKNELRGRPRLDLDLELIVEGIRRHGQVVAAARHLGCSPAYVHERLKRARLTLREVPEDEDLAIPHNIEDGYREGVV